MTRSILTNQMKAELSIVDFWYSEFRLLLYESYNLNWTCLYDNCQNQVIAFCKCWTCVRWTCRSEVDCSKLAELTWYYRCYMIVFVRSSLRNDKTWLLDWYSVVEERSRDSWIAWTASSCSVTAVIESSIARNWEIVNEMVKLNTGRLVSLPASAQSIVILVPYGSAAVLLTCCDGDLTSDLFILVWKRSSPDCLFSVTRDWIILVSVPVSTYLTWSSPEILDFLTLIAIRS